jgi:hypothetical protein
MIIPNIKPITAKRLNQLKKGRNDEDYKNWRLYVLDRDGKQCQYPMCSKTEKLQVHHIRKYITNKHLRTAKFNGITLCEDCHRKIQGVEEHYEFSFFKIVQANEQRYSKKKCNEGNS